MRANGRDPTIVVNNSWGSGDEHLPVMRWVSASDTVEWHSTNSAQSIAQSPTLALAPQSQTALTPVSVHPFSLHSKTLTVCFKLLEYWH